MFNFLGTMCAQLSETVTRRQLGSDRATSVLRSVERDSRLDDSALSGGRAHVEMSSE